MSQSRGFSLIEMMIVIVLMVTITTMVSITIRNSIQTKKKLEYRITNQAQLYDAIRIIRSDVERAFHYQDVFYEIEKKAIDEMNKEINAKARQRQDQTGPPPEKVPLPPPPLKLTHFVGEEDEVHLTSLNHFRTKYNAQESDQMEVGYFVESCVAKVSQKSTKCLYRRFDPYLDDDVTEGGRKMVVAEFVTDFSFKYRSDEENAEWVSQWRSDNKGRVDHQNKFPSQVKMVFGLHEVENKSATPLKETVVMNIHFPNNNSYFEKPPENDEVPN